MKQILCVIQLYICNVLYEGYRTVVLQQTNGYSNDELLHHVHTDAGFCFVGGYVSG